jgi:hypothetical protein
VFGNGRRVKSLSRVCTNRETLEGRPAHVRAPQPGAAHTQMRPCMFKLAWGLHRAKRVVLATPWTLARELQSISCRVHRARRTPHRFRQGAHRFEAERKVNPAMHERGRALRSAPRTRRANIAACSKRAKQAPAPNGSQAVIQNISPHLASLGPMNPAWPSSHPARTSLY